MLINRTAVLILTSLLLSTPGYAEKYRAGNPDTGSDVVIAKGDIPSPEKFRPVVADYMTVMGKQAAAAEHQLLLLQKALTAGDMAAARQAYIQAHYDYEVIRAAVVVFGHADRVINPHAGYFLSREQDPKFTGFHRIEYALFAQNDPVAAQAATADLLRNIADLKQRIAVETLPAAKLVQSADDSIELILSTKLAGDENRYSRSDLSDIAANIEGARRIVSGLAPLLSAKTNDTLRKQFAGPDAVMARYLDTRGQYAVYEKLTPEDKQQLYADLTLLAESLAQLRAELKIDVYYKYRNEQ